jgi:hypothetical protein
MIKALRQLRMVGFAGLLLVCAHVALRAQTTPAKQDCQGSTVDLQGEETARKSRAFLAELQAAVSTGDKTKVAGMISYPLLVIHSSSKARVRTETQFLSQYDSIFDAHVRQAIAQQTAKCLFGNYQGTMIGDGEVWYREQASGAMKIVTVNTSAGRR